MAIDLSRLHQRLYDKIPAFQCIPGCTDCCGPVPWSAWEWDQVERRKALGLHCPYESCTEGCAIYGQRPLLCRLFGASEEPWLQCPHGCRPERQLTVDETRDIMRRYFRVLRRGWHSSAASV